VVDLWSLAAKTRVAMMITGNNCDHGSPETKAREELYFVSDTNFPLTLEK